MKKVMVFGTFDGIHEGHRAMLKEAKALGDYLIAVVAQDHIVEHLKGHAPRINLAERFAHLEAEDAVDEVVIGDAKLSGWGAVKKYKPDVIAVGYDQYALKKDLEKHIGEFDPKPEIKTLAAFEPNKHHNSIMKHET